MKKKSFLNSFKQAQVENDFGSIHYVQSESQKLGHLRILRNEIIYLSEKSQARYEN